MVAPKKTRKHRGHTVQGLRVSLDHIRSYATDLMKTDESMQSKVKKFQSEWRKVFHRKIDATAAQAYLNFLKVSPKKQRGGMAPLNDVMRPGIDGVYGQFPKYQIDGLELPQNSQMQLCGKVDMTPPGANTAQFGSVSQNVFKGGKRTRKNRKQRGGMAFLDSVFQRTVSTDSPTSVMYDAMAAWKGLPPSASPDASQHSFSYLTGKNVPFIPGTNISQITRTAADVTSV
jgi:hypothetical protein